MVIFNYSLFYFFKPQKIHKTALNIFLRVFWVIFISELGDKSMFSTVALATTQNPFAVCFGKKKNTFFTVL
jgi:putative Ca2+/H+ antiporter (TMEM165/GDT1 family)